MNISPLLAKSLLREVQTNKPRNVMDFLNTVISTVCVYSIALLSLHAFGIDLTTFIL